MRQPTGPGGPSRYRRVTEGPGHFALDLSGGTPDPALLPDLGPSIARVSRQSLTSSYLDRAVLPELEEVLRDGMAVPRRGADRGRRRAGRARPSGRSDRALGDRVVVEHPTFPPLLDLLERLGAEVIGVDVDARGHVGRRAGRRARCRRRRGVPPAACPQPDRGDDDAPSARKAARRGARRLRRRSSSRTITPATSPAVALVSLGTVLPGRTVHIRSYSKSHGPDLRLAAVGGAGDVVTAVANRRLLGPGWSSRILQAVLLEMLRPPARPSTPSPPPATSTPDAAPASARCSTARGVPFTGTDGINLWMSVADERSALLMLAAQGIGAAPGEPFLVRPDRAAPADHRRAARRRRQVSANRRSRPSPTASPTQPASARTAPGSADAGD